jgi:hypothetical protein
MGPDGKPLAGARWGWLGETLEGSDFTVRSPKANEKRLLHLVHEDKKLAGLLILQGEEKGPVQVRLQPWGTVSGRVLTEQGDALTGVAVGIHSMTGWASDSPRDVLPDKNGRFRIEGLVPGWEYKGLSVVREGFSLSITSGNPKNLTIRPDETKDLGDIKVKLAE